MTEVTCAIIIKKGLVLAAQRNEKMRHPLKWEFPGGKIEADETPESCLVRELREELNIEIEIVKQLEPNFHTYDYGKMKLFPFLVKYVSGKIQLAEHKSCRWLKVSELGELDWVAADVEVVEKLLKDKLP